MSKYSTLEIRLAALNGGQLDEPKPGSLKIRDGGVNTWTRGISREQACERLAKLGTLKQRGDIFFVTRWDGSRIRAEFFPG